MKTTEQKSKFIELRAKGMSFDKISSELNISKTTLLKWNKELFQEISNIKFLEIQSLIDEHKLSSENKIETLTKKLKEINSVIENIDVASLSIKDILQLKEQIEKDLTKELSNYKYYTGEKELTLNIDNLFELETYKLEY